MNSENNSHDTSTVQKTQPSKKLKWIWLRRILLVIVLLLLILVTGLSWIVGTEAGTRWSLNIAQQHLSELTIDTPSGSLWQGIEAISLRWQQDDIVVQIDAFSTKWRFECLLDAVFCIDKISAEAIDIRLTPSTTEAGVTKSSEPVTLADIALPVDFDLARLSIDTIRVDLADGNDAPLINAIELSASTRQNHVELRTLSLAYQRYSAVLNGGIDLSGEYPLNFLLTASATPLIAHHNQDLNLSITGSLQNLIIDGDTSGFADASISATLKPLDKQLPYSAKVTWDKFSWPAETHPTQIISRKGEITAKGSLQTYAVTLNNSIEGEGIPTANIQLNGEGNYEQFQLVELLVETLGGQVGVNGNVNWRDGIRWAANLNFNNIDPAVQWPDLAGELDGVLVANGLVNGEEISATLEEVAVDGRVLEYPFSLRASAEHASDQTITLKTLTLQIDENDAGVPKTRMAVSGKGDYSHFVASNVKVETLGGEVNGNARIDWPNPISQAPISPDSVQWLAELALSDINPGQQWPDFPGQLSGNLLADGTAEGEAWTLNVKHAAINGQLRQYQLALSAILNRSTDGQFTIDKLALNSGDNQIQVTGSLSEHWSLDGDLLINQAEALLPNMSGTAKAGFRIRGAREAPDVELSANAKSLTFQDISIEAVAIEASIAALGESDSRLTASATSIKTDALVLDGVVVNLSGSRADHQLALSTDGDINTAIKLKGALDDALNWLGTLTSVDVDAYHQAWSLQKPTAIGWLKQSQSIDVAAHCWEQEVARVCLDEDATIAESGNVKFSIRDYSLASLQAYFPKPAAFEGTVAGDGDLKWQAGHQPQAHIKLKVGDGGVTVSGEGSVAPLDLRYQSLSANIAADESRVTAKLLLNSNDIGNASAEIVIDPVAENKTINGNVSLEQLKLVTFKAFFPQLQTLTGTFSANGKISGGLTAPRYVGSVDISGLNVMSNDLPVSISDGFMRAQIDGTGADIDAGWQSGDSPVALTGDADWQDLNSPVINLTLDGEAIEVRQAPTLIAKVSPSIKLGMKGRDINISGRVGIPYARVTIQELPPNATQISKDVLVIVEEELPTEDEKQLRISTNVIVALGKDVRLEGFGLRASLTGDVGIKQETDDVVLLGGEVQITDGIYKAYGQNLTIQRGRLLFVGPVDETAIDIDAVRIVDSVSAGLKVRGSINSPEVTLFSSPQQTQENTLSYIVLGKPIGAKSDGSEAGILTQAALALSIKGGREIATSIAEQFGIQDFQIDTVGDGDESQVQVSGRLSPNLLLSYGVGVLTPVNTLKLRYNLSEGFYVETAQSVESALDFFYTFDF